MHVQIVNFQSNGIDGAAGVRGRPDTGADGTSAIQVRFPNGVPAQCLVTQAGPLSCTSSRS